MINATWITKLSFKIFGGLGVGKIMANWHSYIPILSAFSQQVPPNRPALTRIIEQITVAVIAGGAGAYLGITITQARIDQEVFDLKQVEQDHYAQVVTQMQAQNNSLQTQLSAIQAALYERRTTR